MLMISYNIIQKNKIEEVLKICDIVRYNSAWFNKEELISSLKAMDKPRFVDVHLNRVKDKVFDHDYKELLGIINTLNVEWVGISNVEDEGLIDEIKGYINNGKTKVCAKIESAKGYENLELIASKCDGIMVDKEDLAADVGSYMEAMHISKKIYEYCMRKSFASFELYGVIFNYKQNKILKTVYTYGVFDLLHSGHIRLLNSARELGDRLVLGLVRDEAVSELKGKDRPIQDFEERFKILSELKCVDELVVQDTYDPTPNLIKINPDILTKGDDWDHIPGQDWAIENGKEFIKLPYSKDVSTSDLVSKIRKG